MKTNMSDYKKEIMEALDEQLNDLFNLAGLTLTAFIRKDINQDERDAILGEFNELGLNHIEAALTRIEEAITYDDISIGWDHDCHYRYVFAIQNGQIIYKERVSDDNIPHLDVVRQIDIENYVKSKLSPSEEKEVCELCGHYKWALHCSCNCHSPKKEKRGR